MLVQHTSLRALALDAPNACGTPAALAKLRANILIDTERRGLPSHGVQRLPRLASRISEGLVDRTTHGTADFRRPGFSRIDGCKGLGPVVGAAAIDAAVSVARRHGMALAGFRNANRLSMLARYVERMAGHEVIGIAFSTCETLVHPWGGRRSMLGTNPTAVGVPAPPGLPFILDLATSTVSMGKIHDYAAKGQPIPSDWALNQNGTPTDNRHRAKSGSLTPFGAAKGHGLALAFERLVASWAGSPFAPSVRGTLCDDRPLQQRGRVHLDRSGWESRPIRCRLPQRIAQHSGDDTVSTRQHTRQRRRSQARAAVAHGIEISRSVWDELISLPAQAA